MTDDVRWLTYDEIAETLGIGSDSARNLVRRKRWGRQQGNDGLARIGVPIDHLTAQAPTERKPDGPINPPTDGGGDAGIEGAIIQALRQHIERLERDLDLLRVERDDERSRAVQVDALKAVLEVERARISAAEADRDRWHVEMQAERDARHADGEKAQADLRALQAEYTAWLTRPWWRRAFG